MATRNTALIVDDDDFMAVQLSHTLKLLGYEVVGVAASAHEAYELFRSRAPAVVLMDILLDGDIDGIEAAQTLRRESNCCIIFLTSYWDAETVGRAREVDADGYLVKPYDRGDLQVALELGLYRRFSARDRSLAELVASEGEAAALALLGQMALRGAELPELVQTAVDMVREALDNDLSTVMRCLPGGDALRVQAVSGMTLPHTGSLTVPLHEANPSAYALQIGSAVIANDLRAETRFTPAPALMAQDVVSGVVVLIRAGDRIFGTLTAFTRMPREFTQRDVHVIEGFANMVGMAIQRREVEDSLRRLEHQQQMILHSAGEGICAVDTRGRITMMNPAAARMVGLEPEEAAGRPMSRVFRLHAEAEGAPRLSECPVHATLRDGQGRRLDQVTLQRGDSTAVSVEIAISPIVEDGGIVGAVCLLADVTARRAAEEALRQSEAQLVQAQKMEAMGKLAGGVAHDFNNLLTAIVGCSELVLYSLDAQDPRREMLVEVLEVGERAAGLTRQLLAFSRCQVVALRDVDLNSVVSSVEKLLRRLIGEDVELATRVEPSLPPIWADVGQVEQVVLNLAINSRDAMPRGGVLTIETRAVHRAFGDPSGNLVALEVRDTGCGIDAETLPHIFEPFFTTKAPGEGTGLGLATVYGIVKSVGGDLEVESVPGRGTCFRVLFPAAADRGPAGAPPAVEPSAPLSRGGRTVLVVEDDEPVRSYVVSVLRGGGYRVLAAPDGTRALELCQGTDEAIHLLLTDVVMPGSSGRDLAGWVTALRPDVKVLYMSGYTDDAVLRHGVVAEGTVFLQKPFKSAGLLEKVREALPD